jgi:integrase
MVVNFRNTQLSKIMATLIHNTRSKRQPCWILRYKNPMDGGRYTQLTLHCPRTEAKKVLAKYDGVEVMNAHFPIKRDQPEVEKLEEQFLSAKELEISYNGYQTYKYMMKHFVNYFPKRELASITQPEFEKWRLHELKACKTLATYNTVMKHVRHFLRWCVQMDYLASTPSLKIMNENDVEQRGSWLEINQIEKIMKSAPDEAIDYFTVLLNTGARASEILQKPWQRWRGDYIEIPKAEAKARKPEQLWVNDTVREILTRRRKNEAKMFDFSYTVARRYARNARTNSEIEFTLHDFRRTCGYQLLKSGAGIYEVSRFLRHSSVTTTEKHYLTLLRADYKHLADRINL